MALLDLFRFRRAAPVEPRSIENPRVPVSAGDFWERFGMPGWGVSASGIAVNTTNALGVPSVSAAVNFLSGTMASLPLHAYRRSRKNGRERVRGPLAAILQDAANEEMSSYAWRRSVFDAVFTGGRSVSFIEKTAGGDVLNIWPLDPASLEIKRADGRKTYTYRDGPRTVTYRADEVIDIAFMMEPDGVRHRGPIALHSDVIGMAIAATQYASKFFQNGGVPPFAVTGNFQSGAAMDRAADDLDKAVRKGAKEKRQALVLPTGLEIKPIGADPNKSQMVETHRFLVEQVARIYSLPPVFLQDLTHGTFSNTEQQDLHFVKHTLLRWVDCFEQELNLKLFGRASQSMWVEMSVDGLLRGDFKTRMDGYATAIQHGVMQPNEARALENRPTDDPAGDRLYMQGAMVPLGTTPTTQPADPAPPEGGDPNAA